MHQDSDESLVVVAAWPGQASYDELRNEAVAGRRPRKDYVEIADALSATVVDWDLISHRSSVPRLGAEGAQLVEVMRRRRVERVVAWGDRFGLALAALLYPRRRPEITMVSHFVSTPRRRAVLRMTPLHRRVARIVNYSSVQLQAHAALGVPREKLHLLLQPVDEVFWFPGAGAPDDVICAVGSEARDYPTLVRAVADLPVRLELAVGSMVFTPTELSAGWVPSTLRDVAAPELPANVAVHRHLDPLELRSLYARSRFVVVPLRDVDYDAGVTAITEAMAMGKAVIVTRTGGQVDVLRDGHEGLMVPVGDAPALRAAIDRLLHDPVEAERMGAAGRELVERRHRLDDYVRRFAALVRDESP